jgi:hypothetical protein
LAGASILAVTAPAWGIANLKLFALRAVMGFSLWVYV